MRGRGHRLRLLLASSSVSALLIGGGSPAALAACNTSYINTTSAGCSNTGSITGIAINNSTITSDINNTGTISPNGVSLTNSSTIAGMLNSTGTIGGGISIDASSVITSSGTAAILIGGGTLQGGIKNAGTIAATASSSTAVSLADVQLFTGGITNSGTITSGGNGIGVGFAKLLPNSTTPTGIQVNPIATFTGGVTNTGTVTAATRAIWVMAADSFSGDIVNSASGNVAGGFGIQVGFGTTPTSGGYAVSRFSGSIVNQGIIAASSHVGILVNGVSTFAGDIVNQGTISGGTAGIVVTGVSLFQGRISNAGTIMPGGIGFAPFTGIAVDGVGSFTGGITNTGTVLSGVDNAAIFVANVSAFSGGIINENSLGGHIGIQVTACGCGGIVSTFSGGIFNSGTIGVGGIAGGTGILVSGVATFMDGIHNTGMIAASGGLGSGFGIVVSDVRVFSGGIENGSTGTITATPGIVGSPTPIGILVTNVRTFTGDISNRGLISLTTTGIGISVESVRTFTGNVVNTGTITTAQVGIEVAGLVSTFNGGISNGGLIAMTQPNSSVGILVEGVSLFTGGVRNGGTITGAGVGIAICSCVVTLAGGLTNTGLISADFGGIVLGATSIFGNLSNAGTITVSGASPSNAAILVTGTTFVDGHIVNSGTIGGPDAIDLSGAGGAVTIDQNAGLIAGNILLSPNGDTLYIRGGAINGNIFGQNSGDTINFALGAGTFTYGASFGFSGINHVNVDSGVVVLDGANQATNVAVNGGVLQVGDAANPGADLAGSVDVVGGTLAGHGTVTGAVTVENGGVLFPGGSIGALTIVGGPLTFNPGSAYLVQIAPGAGNNSQTVVKNGSPDTIAINGGTVFALPQLGRYNATTYTIATSDGVRSGMFAGLAFAAPFVFTGSASLSYDPNDVFLNLGDGYALLAPPGTNQNQQNVVNGINNFILGSGNNPPPQFANLGSLSGPALLNALSQLSGENNVGFLQGAYQSGGLFLNLLVNSFLDGRFGAGGGFGPAMGFAAEEPPALPEAAAAFASAMPVKAPYGIATSASAAYRVWGSAFGGAESVDGNAAVGSQRTTSRAFGFAAGVDYPIAPMTTLGFALAGGGTNWGLDGGLGSGHSDMFQAGAYGSHRWGAAYVSAALSYNFHDVTTDRTVTVAGVDRLTANFQAHGIGARLEGGYRYMTPWLGITPYGAVQVQSIFLPGYGETATAGSNQFALNFPSRTATATRTELGAWFDRSTLLANGALLTLYGRAAWAHDFGDTPSASAIFQALPGSNFVVNAAAPAPDSALVTAGAQYRLINGWSFLAKFDGEFSSTTNVYSGTGMVRKTW